MIDKNQFETLGDGLLVRAPAKINLSLLIAGKRADGFHEIETIMAKITWFDEILIQQSRKPGIELICKGTYWAPEGKDNLVYQACESLLDTCHSQANIKVTLTKNIPAGSGLGSASSDAAAMLIGLKHFLQLEVTQQQLCKIAAGLGSDVTFFLGGPMAFCTGKGEKIEKLDKIFTFLAILILPGISVSTKTVYNDYRHDDDLYKKLNTQINALLQKNRVDLVSKMCANMLQTTCFRLHHELADLKTKIESVGLGPLCLSGSGSTMFYLVEDQDQEKAKEYQRKIEEKVGCKSLIVTNNRW